MCSPRFFRVYYRQLENTPDGRLDESHLGIKLKVLFCIEGTSANPIHIHLRRNWIQNIYRIRHCELGILAIQTQNLVNLERLEEASYFRVQTSSRTRREEPNNRSRVRPDHKLHRSCPEQSRAHGTLPRPSRQGSPMDTLTGKKRKTCVLLGVFHIDSLRIHQTLDSTRTTSPPQYQVQVPSQIDGTSANPNLIHLQLNFEPAVPHLRIQVCITTLEQATSTPRNNSKRRDSAAAL